jgi:hypothetical protein
MSFQGEAIRKTPQSKLCDFQPIKPGRTYHFAHAHASQSPQAKAKRARKRIDIEKAKV